MHEARARALIDRQQKLAAERAPYEQQWQEIAELMAPMRADFTRTAMPGENRQSRIFDGTAGLAADNLAAGLWSMITNAANDWFALAHADDDLNRDPEVRVWLDVVTRRMRDAFGRNGQRFYARAIDLYADLVHFGTGIFYVDEVIETGELFFSCRHLAECFIAESDREVVDTLYRRFEWTARQAAQRWGDALEGPVARAAEKEPERRFPFLHAVLPAAEHDRPLPRGHRFASVYVDVEGGRVLSEGGFAEFPFQVPRWSTRSRGLYGEGPGLLVLPDVRMLNAMSKTTIVAAQKAADPPLLAPDENAVRGLRTSPGGIIYGGIDASGRRLYEPLQTGADVHLGLALEEQRRQSIREGFHASLLLMVAQPNQTATEVLARQEEKLRLMAPHLGRVQAEFLDPLITRVFGLMERAGAFPPAPGVLDEAPALKIAYVSPLARAQRAGEGAAILRTLQSVAELAALDPGIVDLIDFEAATRGLAEAFGLPAGMLRDPDAVAALRQGREAAGAEAGATLAALAGAALPGGAGLPGEAGPLAGMPGEAAPMEEAPGGAVPPGAALAGMPAEMAP